MSYIMVDIEADGPIPGDYSMVCFGAIVVEPTLSKTFYGRLKPVSELWIPEALQVSGFSREETLAFDTPDIVMQAFFEWIERESPGRVRGAQRLAVISSRRQMTKKGTGRFHHRYFKQGGIGE